MKTLLLASLAYALLTAGCPPQPQPIDPEPNPAPTPTTPPDPAPSADAGPPPLPPPAGDDRCARGYSRAVDLGCPPEPPCPGCVWVEVCRRLESNGVDMQADCLERATSCPAADLCLSEEVR